MLGEIRLRHQNKHQLKVMFTVLHSITTLAVAAGASSGSGAPKEPCAQCTQPCQRERPCGHACPLPCHPDPCAPCQEGLQQACHCGRSLVPLICHQLQQVSPVSKASLLPLIRSGQTLLL